MKKIALIVSCIALMSISASAQIKAGHINTSEIISLMSERDSAMVKLQAYQADLLETMQGMQDEFNTKYAEFQKKANDWAPVVLEAKQKELQELDTRFQQFQQSAQQDFQQMQNTLMAPVVEKARVAIEKVAKANGLTYVFDLSAGALIYFDDASSLDMLPLVKKELGVPADKVAPTQIGTEQEQ